MRHFFGVVLLLATATVTFGEEKVFLSPKGINLTAEQEAQLKRVTRKVLCACKTCPPTLLDDCLCGTARELKDQLKTRLLEGASPETLLAEYVAENGPEYLAAPPREGFNWAIWIFPAVAFVGLGVVFWYSLQRLTRREEPSSPRVLADVERYRDEIERHVKERVV